MTDQLNPRLWDGTLLSEPGIYANIPIEVYHDQLTVEPSISSSGLRKIEAESPRHWWALSYLNPDRPKREEAAHFALGRAVHTLLLGEDGFRDQYVVRPEEYPDWRTKASQVWRDGMVGLGKTVLVPSDLEVIRGIAQSAHDEPLIREGLFSGLVEHSMVWKDEETGVWLKARPDTLNPQAGVVVDLKTIASADPKSCRDSIAEHGYYMQLALIGEGYRALTGNEIPDDGYLLVFVEKKFPYAVNIKPVDATAIFYGRAQIRRAVRTFATCLERGEWPGYADSGLTAHLPTWLDARLAREYETGELPNIGR